MNVLYDNIENGFYKWNMVYGGHGVNMKDPLLVEVLTLPENRSQFPDKTSRGLLNL